MSRSPRLLGAFFTFAGTMHFVRPRDYEAIVPDYIPIPAPEAVRWSGYTEIAGGLAAAAPLTRGLGRWLLIGVLIAIFPANVHMAHEPEKVAARGLPADRIPRWLLWARLPLQPLLVRWVWRATASR